MDIFPDGLSSAQYALLRSLHMGNVRHFDAADAGALIDKGFAFITEIGDLSATDAGLKVPRILKVNK